MNRLAALLCLAALLLAQPVTSTLKPSVRALLRKPRLGVARLAKDDGTVLNGEVVSVTNEFVALLPDILDERFSQAAYRGPMFGLWEPSIRCRMAA
jgi:hypothetical protein